MVCAGSSVRERHGGSCPATCRRGRWSISKASGGLRQVCLNIWCTIYELCYAWPKVVTSNRQPPFLTAEPCNLRQRVVSALATMVPSEKREQNPHRSGHLGTFAGSVCY